MPPFRIRLKRSLVALALALLNATLMLVAVIVIGLCLLAWKIDAIAASTADRIEEISAPYVTRIEGLETQIAELKQALASGQGSERIDALTAELKRANETLDAARALVSGMGLRDIPVRALVDAVLREAGRRLTGSRPGL